MNYLAGFLTLAIVALGVTGLVAPTRLLSFLRKQHNAPGMAAVAIFRISYGLALYVVGPAASSPEAIRGLGVFVIVGGLITPFIGVARFQALTEAAFAHSMVRVRALSAVLLLFGIAVLSQLPPPSF